jgi:predicted nucleic acid-binding Zn ribbon protein
VPTQSDEPVAGGHPPEPPIQERWVTLQSTADCGQLGSPGDNRTGAHSDDPEVSGSDPARGAAVRGGDAVRRALASARQMRRATASSRELASRRARRRANLRGRSPGYSGPAPDATDPQRLDSVLAEYVDDQGWELPLAQARVFAEWPTLVGPEVAAHCEPVTLRGGELRVNAESTAWAAQLRLLSATMLARLVAELGPQVVTRLVISAPTGPSWRHGRFSVRGARGPRDTYG